MGGTGPAQFPSSDDGPNAPVSDEQARADAKLSELEEARRAGTISDEEYEDRKRRLQAEQGEAD